MREWDKVCVSVTVFAVFVFVFLCVCVCFCVCVFVCWSGGHTVCPPETDWIRSNENRATCPHRNWIKEAIDANQTSMLNQLWINAKQLASAPHDVFKPALLEDKQTGSERRLFSIPSDILLWAQNKREFPSHTRCENGFDWKFRQNLKLVTVERSVFWRLLWGWLASLLFLWGVYVRVTA